MSVLAVVLLVASIGLLVLARFAYNKAFDAERDRSPGGGTSKTWSIWSNVAAYSSSFALLFLLGFFLELTT